MKALGEQKDDKMMHIVGLIDELGWWATDWTDEQLIGLMVSCCVKILLIMTNPVWSACEGQ